MSEYQTEQQQLAAFRTWWQENGRMLSVIVLLALACVVGWRAWQTLQIRETKAAAMQYHAIVQAFDSANQVDQEGDPESDEGGQASESTFVTLKTLVTELQAEFPNSAYSQMAGFYLAKQAFISGDHDLAKTQLQWVIAAAKNPAMQATARQRLARVLWAQGDVEHAQGILEKIKLPAFQAVTAELQGDLWLARDDLDQARTAYRRAQGFEGSVRPFVALKLNDLAN